MAPTPRQLAREHTMREIVRIGRSQLATVGPADLSLRAVARELGVVSSAVYRYVSSRDELLTLLIVDAYDELGDAVDTALADAPGAPRDRLLTATRAVRSWGLGDPSSYALLYGTPVPGYAAPADLTTQPGTRVVLALMQIVVDASEAGRLQPQQREVPDGVRADMERLRAEFGFELPVRAMAAAFQLWSGLFGLVSFDVFDQWGPDTLTDRDGFFDYQVGLLADLVGLA
ncbi:TetR/AcrR family transcriptional regulator [Luteimicrobium sp. NPDC057192]|uniref:TetR/AcrR family transcriptional regulator n=1 Tax=Luteimicrobium sp. NPDC057192 TaxID=3346042 RepID=UPI00362E6FF4